MKLLRRAEVLEMVGADYSTVWRWTKKGEFPEALIVGDGSNRWVLAEVEAWIASRPRRKLGLTPANSRLMMKAQLPETQCNTTQQRKGAKEPVF